MVKLAAAAIAAALVVACSSSSSSEQSSASDDSSSFVSQYCELFTSCCSKYGMKNDGSCVTFFTVSAASGTYDAVAGSACLDKMRAAKDEATFCEASVYPTPCNWVFKMKGSVAAGEKCAKEADCAPAAEGGVACAGATDAAKICQAQVAGKENDAPCVGTKNDSVTTFDYGATPTPSRGFLCDEAEGLYCNSATHACTRTVAVGAKCTGTTGAECGREGTCATSSMTCEAKPPSTAIPFGINLFCGK